MSAGSKIVTKLFGWMVEAGLQKEVESLESQVKNLKKKLKKANATIAKAKKVDKQNVRIHEATLMELEDLRRAYAKSIEASVKFEPVELDDKPYETEPSE